MSEYIEVDGQEVEKLEYIQNDDGEVKIDFDIRGESHITGKTKALIVIMPQYINDIPKVINVGLDLDEIQDAIDLADGAFHDFDTYKNQINKLQNEADRLDTLLEHAKEDKYYASTF